MEYEITKNEETFILLMKIKELEKQLAESVPKSEVMNLKAEIRYIASDFCKDSSEPWHDIRIWENLEEEDYLRFDEAIDELITPPIKENKP